MDFYEKVKKFLDENRDLSFELVRIYLGIGLFAKGVYFGTHVEDAMAIMEGGTINVSNVILAHYIVLAHLGGGLLMTLGLLTRLAALVQIPILVGAVSVIHLREGFFTRGQSLEFAILVLFLLVLVFLHGGGRLSADARVAGSAAETTG